MYVGIIFSSDSFSVSNGTRQGSTLPSYLFARYICDSWCTLTNERVGYNIGGQFINVLAYADDLVLVAPSWRGLRTYWEMNMSLLV